tara:strand:+ start:7393 stop:7788 length:396 start_codon:yes stop_codon:yes gene_type:complete
LKENEGTLDRTLDSGVLSGMKNNDQRLNDLLDAPQLLDGRFKGCLLFQSVDPMLASMLVIGWDGTVGLARSERTGYTVAFTVKGDAKPLRKRNLRPELDVDVLEIDTVANEAGVILGAIGESRGRGWRVVA